MREVTALQAQLFFGRAPSFVWNFTSKCSRLATPRSEELPATNASPDVEELGKEAFGGHFRTRGSPEKPSNKVECGTPEGVSMG